MMLDKNLLVSDDQDLSQVAATYLSDKSIDLGSVANFGKGEPVRIMVRLTETVTSAGAATLQIKLIEASDEALSADVVVLKETIALAKAILVAGYEVVFELPVGVLGNKFIGLQYIIATATTTAGTATAGVVLDMQQADSGFTAVL